MHDNVPPKIPIAEVNRYYIKIEENQQKIEVLLFSLFNQSEEVNHNVFFLN